jgi:DNA repair protein RecN (Recombination protein N)
MATNFYLKKLIIQNFATFKNQTIHFKEGLNTIIGETGSGKSLLLDALQLILGARADKKVVRRETEYSLIEASFHCTDSSVKEFLEGEGFPVEGEELVIKRLVYKNGTTKNYINHLSCTVSFLAHFAKRYIDLVGQFENQKLLSESYQLQLLDHFSKIKPLVAKFRELNSELKNLKQKHQELQNNKSQREQRLDYLNYQLEEIEKINPSSQDEDELIRKKNLLMNVEKNHKLSFQFKEIFDGGEGAAGLYSQVKLLHNLIVKNRDQMGNLIEDISELEERTQHLYSKIEKCFELEVDPEELEGVIERLDQYQKLKKKFGGSVESILQQQIEFLKEREQLESMDIDLESTGKIILDQEKDLFSQAKQLHSKRLHHATRLSTELTQKVQSLKMAGAQIKLVLEELEELTETGITRAFFMAETNPGEGHFKIKDVASGGELSRILLAVRQILSTYDSISIFLFDEIDTGIGGETATAIGKALHDVARAGQVIAITHLPQIARFADLLIVVQKDVHHEAQEKRTESIVKQIIGKDIQTEVRAMAQLIPESNLRQSI